MIDASLIFPALRALAVLAVAVTLVWLASLPLRDAGIADVFWGPGFALLAWLYVAWTDGWPLRGVVVASLVTIWGARLGAHILLRSRGRGEDRRYARWRERAGRAFWWRSWLTVFLFQGLILWIVSWPLLVAVASPGPRRFTPADAVGAALWSLGFTLEAVADAQLVAFRRNPANRGRVLSSGLWAWSRHPNYFGDALLWWGLFCFALPANGGWLTVASPALMTFLLLRVSGVPLLESDIEDRRPGYFEYVARTSSFVLRPPKRGNHDPTGPA